MIVKKLRIEESLLQTKLDVANDERFVKKHEADFSIGDVSTMDLGADFGSLLNSLHDDTTLGNLKKQLQSLQDQEAVVEPLPSSKQQSIEKQLHYNLAKKNAQKWIPQIEKNSVAEQVVFGEVSADLNQSTSSLSSHFRPVNDFEVQLKQAITASGVTEKNVNDAKALAMVPHVREARNFQQAAKLKAILFREQIKNKRLGKIKSKMWRKINRRSDMMEREQLLSRLDEENPDLASKIRLDMEEKRAGLRMMKQQNARKQWAKVALRFGGKDMQKVVSREAQNARDELNAIKRIIKSAPGEAVDNDESLEDGDLSLESDVDEANEAEGTAMRTLKKAKRLMNKEIENSDNETSKRPQGIAGLGFMRQALERDKRKNRVDADSMINEIDSLMSSIQKCDASDYLSESEFAKKPAEKQNVEKKKFALISLTDLEEAEKEMEELFTSNKPKRETHSSSVKVAGPITLPEKIPKSTPQSQEKIHDMKEASPKLTCGVSASTAIDELVKSFAASGALDGAIEQENLIKEAFVSGDQVGVVQGELLALQEEDEDATVAPTTTREKRLRTPGWGSWTGEGTLAPSSKIKDKVIINQDAENKPKPKIYINRKLDRKLASYFVKSVPFPYNSKEHFEISQSHPIGPEWNTKQVHKRLIQPDVHVRPGTVIMPLEYAKHLPKDQVDSLLDAWSMKGKKKAPKSRL